MHFFLIEWYLVNFSCIKVCPGFLERIGRQGWQTILLYSSLRRNVQPKMLKVHVRSEYVIIWRVIVPREDHIEPVFPGQLNDLVVSFRLNFLRRLEYECREQTSPVFGSYRSEFELFSSNPPNSNLCFEIVSISCIRFGCDFRWLEGFKHPLPLIPISSRNSRSIALIRVSGKVRISPLFHFNTRQDWSNHY